MLSCLFQRDLIGKSAPGEHLRLRRVTNAYLATTSLSFSPEHELKADHGVPACSLAGWQASAARPRHSSTTAARALHPQQRPQVTQKALSRVDLLPPYPGPLMKRHMTTCCWEATGAVGLLDGVAAGPIAAPMAQERRSKAAVPPCKRISLLV